MSIRVDLFSIFYRWMFSFQNVDLSAVFGLLVFARFPDVSITCLRGIPAVGTWAGVNKKGLETGLVDLFGQNVM